MGLALVACVQVITVDVCGNTLHTFSAGVKAPRHLALDRDRNAVFAADFVNHRILQLTGQLTQPRYFVDAHSAVKMWTPIRLCYNESTSQLYVVHGAELSPSIYFVSIFTIRSPNQSLLQ